MIRPGLVSVTFRPLSPAEVIRVAAEAGLQGIEWGGDVHVPHGDVDIAKQVGVATREAGLEVAAYGSYYRAGGDVEPSIEAVLESALALGAPLIRVWAGNKGSADVSEEFRQGVVEDLRRICDLAQAAGVGIATEYHGGTLTDTQASCRDLIRQVNHPRLQTLWQPLRRGFADPRTAENLEDLKDVLPELANVHVYEWYNDEEGRTQRASLDSRGQWAEYMPQIQTAVGDRWMLLEFLPGDDPAVLGQEAAALRDLILR